MIRSTTSQDIARRRGFTFTELLVCLFIVCMLAGFLFGQANPLTRARETANRVKCGSNLRQIGQAMLLYGNENKGNYPRTIYQRDKAITQYTGLEAKDPFAKDTAIKPNDVTAAIFLLIRTQDITPDVFVCPSTDLQPVKFAANTSAQDFGNFKSGDTLGYSIANPYPSTKAIEVGYKWNVTLGAEFAIAADMNPGQFEGADVTPAKGPRDERAPNTAMRMANTYNHNRDGENVLYADGHVEFVSNPFCGVKRDNIYTVSGSDDGSKTTSETIDGSPTWAGDSVLLPVATVKAQTKTQAERDAADLDEVRAVLPAIKARLAEQQKWVEEMEKKIAEADAKKK
jgi:prepilin-type N-terminal cleavage/methylation domain-containing protein